MNRPDAHHSVRLRFLYRMFDVPDSRTRKNAISKYQRSHHTAPCTPCAHEALAISPVKTRSWPCAPHRNTHKHPHPGPAAIYYAIYHLTAQAYHDLPSTPHSWIVHTPRPAPMNDLAQGRWHEVWHSSSTLPIQRERGGSSTGSAPTTCAAGHCERVPPTIAIPRS